VQNKLDCDDDKAEWNTSAPDDECDALDQNCNLVDDDGFFLPDCKFLATPTIECRGKAHCQQIDSATAVIICTPRWFDDKDGDLAGGVELETPVDPTKCPNPTSSPNVKYTDVGGDCDDDDPDRYPDKEERCDDGIDQNCDGRTGQVLLRQTFGATNPPNEVPAGVPWSAGTNSGWAFGQATSTCGGPSADVTSTDDGMVAGVGVASCPTAGNAGELFSPTVDASDAAGLAIVFWEWMGKLPAGAEKKPPSVSLSVQQGATRTTIHSPLKAESEWIEYQRDLSSFAGDDVQIVWSYDSGDAVDWAGYAIDDVLVTDERCTP
jgi:hypothetical protein